MTGLSGQIKRWITEAGEAEAGEENPFLQDIAHCCQWTGYDSRTAYIFIAERHPFALYPVKAGTGRICTPSSSAAALSRI